MIATTSLLQPAEARAAFRHMTVAQLALVRALERRITELHALLTMAAERSLPNIHSSCFRESRSTTLALALRAKDWFHATGSSCAAIAAGHQDGLLFKATRDAAEAAWWYSSWNRDGKWAGEG